MSILKGLHNAVALDYHYEKNLVFWTENNMKVIRVARMDSNNMSGKNGFKYICREHEDQGPINSLKFSDVIRWGLETPGGVAVDWIHDLLFWTDSGTRRVEVATLDGSQRAVLAASDVDKPRAIAVHPGDALVFWTDWGKNEQDIFINFLLENLSSENTVKIIKKISVIVFLNICILVV